MALKEIQEMVHKWISQYEEGYWPLHKQFAQLVEEMGEMAREIERMSVIPDYLADNLANNLEFLKAIEMAKKAGDQARKALDKSGRKRKEETNKESSVSAEGMDIQFALVCLMNSERLDMDLAFVEMMSKKRYGRDDSRFKKKGRNQFYGW